MTKDFWTRVGIGAPDECWLWEGYVLHRCDVRACVNPAHLFLGSHQDNMADMVTKGRQVHGEAQHMARLTEKDVLDIRQNPARTLQSWADALGVSAASIHNVRVGKTWKHVGGFYALPDGSQGERHHMARLTEKDVQKILISEWTDKDLATHFKVSVGTVWNVRKRKTWKHIHTSGPGK